MKEDDWLVEMRKKEEAEIDEWYDNDAFVKNRTSRIIHRFKKKGETYDDALFRILNKVLRNRAILKKLILCRDK